MSSAARRAELLKCLPTSRKLRLPPAELFPALYRHIDVSGIDVHAATNAFSLLGCNQCGPRTQERVIDSIPSLAVIQDRAAHQLRRLLRSMTGSGLEPIASKWVQVGHLPDRRLRAVAAPIGCAPRSERTSSRVRASNDNGRG